MGKGQVCNVTISLLGVNDGKGLILQCDYIANTFVVIGGKGLSRQCDYIASHSV